MIDEADLGRFAELEAIAALQPLWALHDETDVIIAQRLDAARLERRYPFGRLLGAGATLAMASDWNVTTADPLRIMHVATERTPPGAPARAPLGPSSERLPLETCLQAYTSGSARVNRLDHISGRIAVGRAADLVLLDRDPVGGGVPLRDCRVRMTVVAGRVVHRA
jgi:predicted amidohydrolase YtcJ